MTNPKLDHFALLCLRLGAFLCFAGWTWVHFYWEAPYGVLVWQDSTLAFAGRFGISWENFVGTGANDGFVQKWLARIGWLYLLCAILTLTVRKKSRIQMGALILGSCLLTILSYAKYVAAQRQLPMFIEHGGQFLIPVLLVMALALGVCHRVTVRTAIVAFTMIFVGHGLYALGYHWPTPANFHAMTTIILHVDHETSRTFLRIAGVLDLVVCIGIFVPVLRRPCVLYAAVWGLLTALARPVAGMSLSLNFWGTDQYIHEAVLRAPHFMIPLYLYAIWLKPAMNVTSRSSTNTPDPESANSANLPST